MVPDEYGHCVVCHKNMIIPRVVGGEIKMVFHPDHDHTEFLISNISRMVVCMCKKCKENIDLSSSSIQDIIMDSVKSGWEKEGGSPQGYKDLKILFHSEGIDDYVVRDRLKKIGILNGNN